VCVEGEGPGPVGGVLGGGSSSDWRSWDAPPPRRCKARSVTSPCWMDCYVRTVLGPDPGVVYFFNVFFSSASFNFASSGAKFFKYSSVCGWVDVCVCVCLCLCRCPHESGIHMQTRFLSGVESRPFGVVCSVVQCGGPRPSWTDPPLPLWAWFEFPSCFL